MNKSDCFILDTGKGKTIFVFMPPGSSFILCFLIGRKYLFILMVLTLTEIDSYNMLKMHRNCETLENLQNL